MKGSKKDLIKYRLEKAREAYQSAKVLGEHDLWDSAINRLYYAVFYAVSALLLSHDLNPTTHKGAKSNFSEHFVKNGIIDKQYGKLYTQLFIWRHKGDYDDLFGFEREIVEPYFGPVENFIKLVESRLQE